MPIYSYKCPICKEVTDLLLPVKDGDASHRCKCGAIMKRLITSATFVMAQTARGLVTDTLNREYKTLPPEQVGIMAPGLERPEKPVVGRGF